MFRGRINNRYNFYTFLTSQENSRQIVTSQLPCPLDDLVSSSEVLATKKTLSGIMPHIYLLISIFLMWKRELRLILNTLTLLPWDSSRPYGEVAQKYTIGT